MTITPINSIDEIAPLTDKDYAPITKTYTNADILGSSRAIEIKRSLGEPIVVGHGPYLQKIQANLRIRVRHDQYRRQLVADISRDCVTQSIDNKGNPQGMRFVTHMPFEDYCGTLATEPINRYSKKKLVALVNAHADAINNKNYIDWAYDILLREVSEKLR